MGLFGGDTEYVAEVLASKIIDQDNIPNIAADAVITAIMSGADPADHLLAAQLTQFSTEGKRYYNYGKREETTPGTGYINGLPDITFYKAALNTVTVDTYIEEQVGKEISISQSVVRRGSLHMYVYDWLQTTYNWSETKNELTENGILYALESFGLVTSIDEDDMFPPVIGSVEIILHSVDMWEENNYEVIYAPPHNNIHDLHIQVRYTETAAPEKGYYYYYEEFDPILHADLVDDTFTIEDEHFYPVALIREDKVNLNDGFDEETVITDPEAPGFNPEAPDYLAYLKFTSTKRLLKKINLDLEDIIGSLTGDVIDEHTYAITDPSDPNYNPDDPTGVIEGAAEASRQKSAAKKSLKEMDTVFISFALSLYTQQQDSLEYLYTWFEEMWTALSPINQLLTKADWTSNISKMISTSIKDLPSEELEFSDEGDFNTTFFFDYLEMTEVEGIFHPPTNEKDPTPMPDFDATKTPYTSTVDFQKPESIYPGTEPDDPWSFTNAIIIFKSTITYRKQFFADPEDPTTYDHYLEFELMDPRFSTKVHAYRRRRIVLKRVEEFIRLPEKQDPGYREGLSHPVSKYRLEKMRGFKKSYVLYDALYITIYAMSKIDIPWYATSWFKGIMMIIAIVLSIWTGGASIVAVQAAFGVSQAVAVIILVAIAFALPFVMELIIKHVGGKLGLVLAAILAVAVSMFLGGGGLNLQSLFTIPSAMQMLSIVSALGRAVQQYTGIEAELLTEEESIFNKEVAAREEELDKLTDMFGDGSSILNPLYLDTVIQPISAYESPREYYDRKLMANPGVLVFDIVHSYHEIHTQLPRLEYSPIGSIEPA